MGTVDKGFLLLNESSFRFNSSNKASVNAVYNSFSITVLLNSVLQTIYK